MAEQKHITLCNVVKQSKDTISSSIDTETVLLSIVESSYYGMGPTGSRIWQLLEQPIRVGDLIQILLQEYEIEYCECEKDVISFLNNLRAENLIDIHTT
ncbi:MAG: lasso peptide biosynthesis PqqD family chaperone [Pseudomonadota bacterium]